MGRYVRVNGEVVWKYVVAEQASEQNRISIELGIGEIRQHKDDSGNDGDILRLERSLDIKKLNDYLDEEIEITFEDCEISRIQEIETIDGKIRRFAVPLTRRKVINMWERINKSMFPVGWMTLSSLEFRLRRMIMTYIPNIHFWTMVRTYVEYMEKHPDVYGFDFVGEY